MFDFKDDGFFHFAFVASVIISVIISIAISMTVIKGNFWYTKSGALEQLKNENPGIEKIVKSKRNIWRRSVFVIKEGEQIKTFLLDTNILWNYKFEEKKD